MGGNKEKKNIKQANLPAEAQESSSDKCKTANAEHCMQNLSSEPQKHAPSPKSANPMIAARMIVKPNKQKSIARTRYPKNTYHSLMFPDARPLATAPEGSTSSKLLSRFYGNDGTKFPKY